MLYELVRQESGEIGPPSACEAIGVSRSGYWAWLHAKPRGDDPLLPRIRKLAERPRYGYRRITAELHREGITANHRRVLTLMRENGLLCKRPRFKVITTDSNHGLPVHPNLAKGLEVTSINQLWVADITYVHLSDGFAYLAVILDRFSRRCIGWQLSRNIDAQLCLGALHMAFASRKGASLAGLVHHSDQGVQYASSGYVRELENRGIRVSMSRRGNPYDNAYAESFHKTVKVEEVFVNEYEGFEDARQNIKRFIEVVYNKKRLHSALGYLPPAEFEQQVLREVLA